ncbi:MAG TPA: glycosyltransferase family 2 protein [Acidisarcina sp.]
MMSSPAGAPETGTPETGTSGAGASSTVRVQVCLLTYKRAELLRSALKSLLEQTAAESSPILMHILVVDNDEAMSGRAVFDEALGHATRQGAIPCRYVSEPSRGLSAARNRALDESGGMDYVAFLDDDEVAERDWLKRLLDASERFDADVTTGPVWPLYVGTPAWIVRGGFFSARQRATGASVDFVATNNVLLRGKVAASFRFDGRFDATGGEDTEFFMRIKRAGYRMVWANEALVSECIPPSRANAAWLLSRARSDANRYTRSCLSLDSSVSTVIGRLVIASGGFLAGMALLPFGIFGRQYAVRALQYMWRAAGTISALRGGRQIYYEASGVPAAEPHHG